MLRGNYYKQNKDKIKNVLVRNSNKDSTGREVISTRDEWANGKEWDDMFCKLSEERSNRGFECKNN